MPNRRGICWATASAAAATGVVMIVKVVIADVKPRSWRRIKGRKSFTKYLVDVALWCRFSAIEVGLADRCQVAESRAADG